MNHTDIITRLYNEQFIEKLAKPFKSYINPYYEDFISEMYMILCNLSAHKLTELYKSGELSYYMYYIIKAQATNPISDFNKLYRTRINTVELTNENL